MSVLALIRRWRERRNPFSRRLGIRGAREYIAVSPRLAEDLCWRAQSPREAAPNLPLPQ